MNPQNLIQIKNEDGFTLIEIMVSILIMFTLVSLIISFYLFANKFIRITSLNINEKEKINRFVFNLSETINKSKSFNILTNQNYVLIQLGNHEEITFSNKAVSIDKYYQLNNIESYKLIVHFENGDNIVIDSKKEIKKVEKISVEQLSSMNIEIDYNSKKYLIEYYKPQISVLKFINIE